MMTTPPAVFELADSFSHLIFEMAWKSTIILGSVVLLGKLLKQRSASCRRILYSTGILTMLCFMLINPISPRWTINTPDWLSVFSSEKTTLNQSATEPESQSFQSGDGNLGFGNESSNENKTSGAYFIALMMTIFPFVWLAITLFLLGRLIADLFRLKHLRQTSSVVVDAGLNFLVHEVAENFGCEIQGVTTLQNEAIEMPVTWGIFRHFILLPREFEKLPAESCRAILIHELAHIKRYDFVNRIFTEVLCAVLWFQPLAWAARKNLKEAQERAADDCVLEMGEKASGYAKLLLEWNDRLPGKGFSMVPGVIEQKSLKSRLEAILNPETRRRPMTVAEMTVICLIIFSLAIPLTGLGISKSVKPLAELDSFESPNLPTSSQKKANSPGSSDLTQQANFSKAKAIEIATNFQPGTVIESEFGQSDEGIIYKILIRNEDATKGDVTRLTINALDGRIIRTWRGIRK
jgi:beta-lactamase regulating signal transducer with metallopeptidase domain